MIYDTLGRFLFTAVVVMDDSVYTFVTSSVLSMLCMRTVA